MGNHVVSWINSYPFIFYNNGFELYMGIWAHVKYLGTLFSEMSKPPENVDNQLAYYITNFPKFIFYMICYFIGAGYSIALSPFFITIYTFFKSISANYIVREKKASEPNKPLNILILLKMHFITRKHLY